MLQNKKNKKTGSRKKRVVRQNRMRMLVVPGTFMPDRLRTKLWYDFLQYPLMAAASSGALNIGGNDAYDPDRSGSGHQPMGFDQLTSIYDRYVVTGSRVRITLLSTDKGITLGLIPSTDTGTPSSLNNLLENPYSKHLAIPSSYPCVLNHSFSSAKIWGVSESTIIQDDTYHARYNASPTRPWYWLVKAGTFDGSTTATVYVNIRVSYIVEFYERIQESQS